MRCACAHCSLASAPVTPLHSSYCRHQQPIGIEPDGCFWVLTLLDFSEAHCAADGSFHVEISSPLPFHGTALSCFPFSFPGCSSNHVLWAHFLQQVPSILGFFGFRFRVLFPMGCHGEILSASLSFIVFPCGDSLAGIFRPHFSPELQTQTSNSLEALSSWLSHRHKVRRSQAEVFFDLETCCPLGLSLCGQAPLPSWFCEPVPGHSLSLFCHPQAQYHHAHLLLFLPHKYLSCLFIVVDSYCGHLSPRCQELLLKLLQELTHSDP